MLKSISVLLAGVMISACGAVQEPLSTVKDDPAAKVEAFKGQVAMLHPDGRQAGMMEVITRTRTFPSQNLIIEQTIQVDQASPDNPTEMMVMITVDGTDMSLVELHDQFAGSGAFTAGEAWDWTAWNFDVVLEDGLKMSSQMSKGTGSVDVAQQLKTENGDLVFSFDGTMTEITEAQFKSRYKEIFPPDNGGGGDDDDDDDDD